jgi:predicted phage gp36 major capsid-like protein
VTTFTTLQAEETNLEHDLGDQADQRAELAQQPPAPEEPAAVLEQFQARIEELTQERDQARRALDQARQELDPLTRLYERGPVEPALVQKLDTLRPHLARSVLVSARLQLERARTASETLALIGLAALVIDENGKVVSL